MYVIDPKANRIAPLAPATFRELRFGERSHLQEWLANCPEALEPLLILQKEFSGWDKTNERLDLLALDKAGRLVVIELKLDDSGRDVTWQALKYAAYCSQLKTGQIVDLFRRYRNFDSVEDARAVILEFLGREEEDELALNPSNSQRVMLVAAKFRPEVTATALWLLGRGLDVSCYQVTAFRRGEDLFLGVDQIIPVAEAGDYMVTLAEKAQEEEGATRQEAERHRRRRAYWERLLAAFEARGIPYYRGRSPSPDNWLNTPLGVAGGGVVQVLVVTQGDVRVQVNLERPDAAANAAGFAVLLRHRAEIERAFAGALGALAEGIALDWGVKDGVKSRRIVAALQIDTTQDENLGPAIDFQARATLALIGAVEPLLAEVEAAMNRPAR